MKVLIVDDEEIERIGLSTILLRNFPSLTIMQAKNAKVAIEMTEAFQPELIFMDIKMPGMSGLEAVEHLHSRYPTIKYIMITAYATFDYAHEALKLGVKDYLLKPSKKSEIIETVARVMGEIEAEQAQRRERSLKEQAWQKALPIMEADIVTQLLFDHVHGIQVEELIELLGIQGDGQKFVMSLLIPKGSEHFYTKIKEHVQDAGYVGALYGRQLPIIVMRDRSLSFRSQAITLARKLLALAPQGERKKWFIGIGNCYDSFEQIRKSYQESLIATKDTSLHVSFRFYSDLPEVSAGGSNRDYKEMEKRLFEQIRNGQWTEVSDSLVKLIHQFEQEQTNLNHAQQRVLELLWIASRVLHELGIEAEPPLYSAEVRSYGQLMRETNLLLQLLQQVYEEYYEQLENDSIQQIKRYIIDNSHLDISLEGIAAKVNLSPIYISKLFKDQLGINYITFLTECRIEKAKKLMTDGEKSLKEITFEVGYQDPNYFSKVFKKLYGVTPKEYRKTLMGVKG
ncbi:AraC family transcriptional regulator [Bacillus coahuilensis m2-6]|uniref:response regulator n=1 Tax=Bacillus coahuilensis TaxID=408580 RepID=UPI0001850904|nr:response regulator [Bacillus coahuilensis]KUP04851.1 AraC family transcriptional regulator [Bacillus coahuilensis m2-6]